MMTDQGCHAGNDSSSYGMLLREQRDIGIHFFLRLGETIGAISPDSWDNKGIHIRTRVLACLC